MISRKLIIISGLAAGAILAVGCAKQEVDLGAQAQKTGQVPAEAPKAAPGEKIPWTSNYEDAVKQAKSSGKLMLVDLYTDWCQWCKVLDEKTYPDPTVVERVKDFVPVRINAEKEGLAVARKYQVQSYPMILFIDGDGSVAGLINSYVTPPEMLDKIGEIQKGDKEFRDLRATAEKNPNDFDTYARFATIAAMRMDIKDAEPAMARVEKLKPTTPSLGLSSAYTSMGTYYGVTGQFDKAIHSFKKAIESAPAEQQRLLAEVNLGSAYLNSGDYKAGSQIIGEVLKKKDLSAEGRKALQDMLEKAKAKLKGK